MTNVGIVLIAVGAVIILTAYSPLLFDPYPGRIITPLNALGSLILGVGVGLVLRGEGVLG
jgi:hypothetical protein